MIDPDQLKKLKGMVPFYVNKTLDGDDIAEFETALDQSPELQREVEKEIGLQAKIRRNMQAELDELDEPSSAPFQTLSGSPEQADEASNSGGLTAALSFLNPANWKPAITFALAAAAVAQAVIIGGQSGTIGDQDIRIAKLEAENYQLASGNCDCNGEASIIVELSETAQWGDVAELLGKERLLITRSTAQGVLLLRHANDEEEVEPIIDRLNGSNLVASAAKAA